MLSHCPTRPSLENAGTTDAIHAATDLWPTSWHGLTELGEDYQLAPPDLALLLEAAQHGETPDVIWKRGWHKLADIMLPSIKKGSESQHDLQLLSGRWARLLASHRDPICGPVVWAAFMRGIAVQEYNAGMGLVAAAPTGGAAGTLPSALLTAAEALDAPPERLVQALLVASLLGYVAFHTGPVSGAQAGCGAEIGVASGMAAAAVAWLLGGSWREIDAAASLAMASWIGSECSPSQGLVEWPCVPRNGFAAVDAIVSAEAALCLSRAGENPPYDADYALRAVFSVGALLDPSLREREDGHWTQQAQSLACQLCRGCGRTTDTGRE